MTTLKARFDGRVFVPIEPVDLPPNCVVEVHIADAELVASPANGAAPAEKSIFAALAELSRTFPDDPDTPTDLAAQHDHYLHGMPKRP